MQRYKVIVTFMSLACMASASVEALAQAAPNPPIETPPPTVPTVPPTVPTVPPTVPTVPPTVPTVPPTVPTVPPTVPTVPPTVPTVPPTVPPAAALDCAGNLTGINVQTDVTACRKPHLNYQSLINTSTTINDIVVGRFNQGGQQVQPVGLLLTTEQEIDDRLSPAGPVTIIPTTDAVVPQAPALWNIWVDGKLTWQDEDDPVSDMDGLLANIMLGADYKVASNLVVGVIGTFETSDMKGDGILPPSLKTKGWGGGGYLGWNLSDSWVFSANLLATSLDSKINGLPTVDSVRLQTSESLTGYFYSGTWRISPSLTFAWSKEWQDGTGGLNDQTIETAILSPGFQLGNTMAIGGATTLEPWMGATLDWAMRNRAVDEVLGTVFSDPHVDLRLQGGLNFAFGGNAQLGLSGEVAGLLRKDFQSYTGGVNFAWQF